TSIKRLAFRGCIQLADLGALAPILPQLEFFSMDLVVQKSTLLRALPHLNSCTHLNFNARISGQCVVRWTQVNPALASRVTHLHLTNVEDIETLHRVCDHFPSLQLLYMECEYDPLTVEDEDLAAQAVEFTEFTAGQLAKLKHLEELELSCIKLVLPRLETAMEQFKLPQMPNLKHLRLYYLQNRFTSKRFSSIFSVLFPDLERLKFITSYKIKKQEAFRQNVRAHFHKIERIKLY